VAMASLGIDDVARARASTSRAFLTRLTRDDIHSTESSTARAFESIASSMGVAKCGLAGTVSAREAARAASSVARTSNFSPTVTSSTYMADDLVFGASPRPRLALRLASRRARVGVARAAIPRAPRFESGRRARCRRATDATDASTRA